MRKRSICSLCVQPIATHFCVDGRDICLDCAMWQTPELNDIGGHFGLDWTVPFHLDFSWVSTLHGGQVDFQCFFEYHPSAQNEYMDADFLWRHTSNG